MQISRRSFLKKGAIAVGVVSVCGPSGAGKLYGQDVKEREMPHVIVKLWPGRSEQEKKQLADAIVKDVVTFAKCDESSVSVAIEEIKSTDWAEKVYKPDIIDNANKLYKKPGYKMWYAEDTPITADVEVIPIRKIKEAWERMVKPDVK